MVDVATHDVPLVGSGRSTEPLHLTGRIQILPRASFPTRPCHARTPESSGQVRGITSELNPCRGSLSSLVDARPLGFSPRPDPKQRIIMSVAPGWELTARSLDSRIKREPFLPSSRSNRTPLRSPFHRPTPPVSERSWIGPPLLTSSTKGHGIKIKVRKVYLSRPARTLTTLSPLRYHPGQLLCRPLPPHLLHQCKSCLSNDSILQRIDPRLL